MQQQTIQNTKSQFKRRFIRQLLVAVIVIPAIISLALVKEGHTESVFGIPVSTFRFLLEKFS